MYFKIEFETAIRGYHVYQSTPIKEEKLNCVKDIRQEGKEFDYYAIGVNKEKENVSWSCSNPIEILMYQCDERNKLIAIV